MVMHISLDSAHGASVSYLSRILCSDVVLHISGELDNYILLFIDWSQLFRYILYACPWCLTSFFVYWSPCLCIAIVFIYLCNDMMTMRTSLFSVLRKDVRQRCFNECIVNADYRAILIYDLIYTVFAKRRVFLWN